MGMAETGMELRLAVLIDADNASRTAMGDVMAEIVSPDDGEILSQIQSPTGGIVFFAHTEPLVREETMIYKIIRRLHQ